MTRRALFGALVGLWAGTRIMSTGRAPQAPARSLSCVPPYTGVVVPDHIYHQGAVLSQKLDTAHRLDVG